MAKNSKPVVKDEEDDDKKVLTPQEQMKLYMDTNKKDHLNYETGDDYTVSTGSLKMDIVTNGGIGPGLTRLVGINSGGKTSEGLELMRNFFITRPKGRGVYVKAEGRLSKEIQARSGIKFVWHADDWDEGTCLVLETNIYETVANMIMNHILDNPFKVNYFFMIDSLDGLLLKDDKEKALNDNYKVAGAPSLSKKLLQRCSNYIGKFGHILVATSQITAQPKIDPYAKSEYRPYESSGGNALKHYADNVWEFLPRYNDDKILENPAAKYNQNKNPIIGHSCKVIIRKSSNEKNDVHIDYPIRYNKTSGTSIWIEREIGDLISVYHVTVKKSWFEFYPPFYEELLTVDPDAPQKIQGIEKLYKYLEEHPKVTDYLFKKFQKSLKQEQIWDGDTDPLAEEE